MSTSGALLHWLCGAAAVWMLMSAAVAAAAVVVREGDDDDGFGDFIDVDDIHGVVVASDDNDNGNDDDEYGGDENGEHKQHVRLNPYSDLISRYLRLRQVQHRHRDVITPGDVITPRDQDLMTSHPVYSYPDTSLYVDLPTPDVGHEVFWYKLSDFIRPKEEKDRKQKVRSYGYASHPTTFGQKQQRFLLNNLKKPRQGGMSGSRIKTYNGRHSGMHKFVG